MDLHDIGDWKKKDANYFGRKLLPKELATAPIIHRLSNTRCNILSSAANNLPFSIIPNGKPERNVIASRIGHKCPHPFSRNVTANVQMAIEEGKVE